MNGWTPGFVRIAEKSFMQYYTIRDYGKVENYLKGNLFLLPFLYSAREKIKEYFNASDKFFLEVSIDPEYPESKILNIFIQSKMSPSEAFDTFNIFDREWLLDNPSDILEKVSIDVEFCGSIY